MDEIFLDNEIQRGISWEGRSVIDLKNERLEIFIDDDIKA